MGKLILVYRYILKFTNKSRFKNVGGPNRISDSKCHEISSLSIWKKNWEDPHNHLSLKHLIKVSLVKFKTSSHTATFHNSAIDIRPTKPVHKYRCCQNVLLIY